VLRLVVLHETKDAIPQSGKQI
jgi:NAD(P)-dependent dehydrogenase (short-subunit alcohol dehydrogenase family)